MSRSLYKWAKTVGLHERTQLRATVQQIILIALGIITIYIAEIALH